MTEFFSPGDPLPHIPDDLTLTQFIFNSTHKRRPHRPQGSPWLIEDATGRKIGREEVVIPLFILCLCALLERLLKDSVSCLWPRKRLELEVGNL